MHTYGLFVHIAGFFSTSLSAAVQLKLSRFQNFFLCLHVIIRAMFLKWKIISHTQDLLICCCYSVVFHLAYVYTMGENSGGHVNKQKFFPGRVLLYGSSLHAGELLMILLFSAKERGWENPPCEKSGTFQRVTCLLLFEHAILHAIIFLKNIFMVVS